LQGCENVIVIELSKLLVIVSSMFSIVFNCILLH
jgi:hypothetical protein